MAKHTLERAEKKEPKDDQVREYIEDIRRGAIESLINTGSEEIKANLSKQYKATDCNQAANAVIPFQLDEAA